MSDYIVLVRMPKGNVLALMDEKDNIAIYPNEEEAERSAESTNICKAFGYQIVELDQ
jgi:hypothetical protein